MAVFLILVFMEVEKVLEAPPSDSLRAWSLRKTSANDGAGTLTWQEPLLQVIVWMFC